MVMSGWILLRMKNFSDKCTENQNTNFVFSNFFVENRDVYEVIWTNMGEPDRFFFFYWAPVVSAPGSTAAMKAYCTSPAL
jgi:hypothetical protein